jgi:hypothetical protein
MGYAPTNRDPGAVSRQSLNKKMTTADTGAAAKSTEDWAGPCRTRWITGSSAPGPEASAYCRCSQSAPPPRARRVLRNRNPTSPSHHPVCAKAANNLMDNRTGTARVTEPDQAARPPSPGIARARPTHTRSAGLKAEALTNVN